MTRDDRGVRWEIGLDEIGANQRGENAYTHTCVGTMINRDAHHTRWRVVSYCCYFYLYDGDGGTV